MAPKKSRKVVQKTVVEEPTQDPDVPPQTMSGEEQKDSEGEEDRDNHEDHERKEKKRQNLKFYGGFKGAIAIINNNYKNWEKV
jgi:hypothetical protein